MIFVHLCYSQKLCAQFGSELSFILKDHFQDLSLISFVTYDCENHIFQLFLV